MSNGLIDVQVFLYARPMWPESCGILVSFLSPSTLNKVCLLSPFFSFRQQILLICPHLEQKCKQDIKRNKESYIEFIVIYYNLQRVISYALLMCGLIVNPGTVFLIVVYFPRYLPDDGG